MLKRSPFGVVRAVTFALVLREMRGRFGKVRMGAFWTLAEPLAHILIVAVVFGYLRSRRLPGFDYAVFLLTGLGPFLLFKNTALRLIDSADANKALFAYRQIKPLDTFFARAIVEFSLATIVYILLLIGFGWYGYDISVTSPLEWLGILGIGFIFAIFLGIIFAVLVEAAPEFRFFIRLMFLPMYFLSGVIFPPFHMPPQILPYLMWNPFLHIIELIRFNVFSFYPMAYGVSLGYVLKCTLITGFVALGLYRIRRFHLQAS